MLLLRGTTPLARYRNLLADPVSYPLVMSAPGQNRIYDLVTKHTPSGQAKRGDQKLEQTRRLVEQYGSLIHPDDRAIISERITQ